MRLVDRRLQHRQRIRHFIFGCSIGRERVRAGRIQLDPIRSVRDLIPRGSARFLRRTYDRRGKRIFRYIRIFRLRAPHNAARRHLITRTVDAPFVDRVANGDVAVSVPVARHIARGRESGAQIELGILHSDQHVIFGCALRFTRVEHVRVRVDQAGKHGRLAQIDDGSAGRNFDASLRSNRRDSFARKDDDLVFQHQSALAVEQVSGADRHGSRSGPALLHSAVGPDTRDGPRASPRRRYRSRWNADGLRSQWN